MNLLILCPSLHHRAVVYAVYDDFVDAERLEVRLLLKVPWHLPRGSGGGERAWKTDEDDLLVGNTLSEIDLLGREAEVEDEARVDLGSDK